MYQSKIEGNNYHSQLSEQNRREEMKCSVKLLFKGTSQKLLMIICPVDKPRGSYSTHEATIMATGRYHEYMIQNIASFLYSLGNEGKYTFVMGVSLMIRMFETEGFDYVIGLGKSVQFSEYPPVIADSIRVGNHCTTGLSDHVRTIVLSGADQNG